MALTRRDFLRSATVVTAGALTGVAAYGVAYERHRLDRIVRDIAVRGLPPALDGLRIGFLQSFEGGQMVAELATHKMGPSNFEKKQVTTIKWGEVKFKTGVGMSKGIYEWMQSAFDMGVLYKSGAVTVADFNYKAQRRMEMVRVGVECVVWWGGTVRSGELEAWG